MRQEIERLFSQGHHSQLSRLIAESPDHFRTALPPVSLLQAAIACSICGDEARAETLYLDILARHPDFDDAYLNFGVFRLQQKRYEEALTLLNDYLARRPGDPNGLYNLGLAQFALGSYQQAASRLDQYLSRYPNDASAKLYLARCAIELENHDAAERFGSSLRLEELDGLREWYEFARLQSALDRTETAASVYQQIIARFPEETPALINLAMLRERTNQTREGLDLLDSLGPDAQGSHHYWLARARLLGGSGRFNDALSDLDRARQHLSPEIPDAERESLLSEIEFERGHHLDKLQRNPEAFAAFAAGNGLARQRYRRISGSNEETIDAKRYRDDPAMDPIVLRRYRADPASDTPIFLVGFPRSGTTLLDQILDAHPALQVMEEKPALESVAQSIEERFGSVGEALEGVEDSVYRDLQSLYESTVSRYLKRQIGTQLVDKYPLSIARLPLGMALFPQSRWIFAVRHPCDVVLSCFMQNFRYTRSTLGFWSLEQTAEIYARTMTLWLNQRDRLRPYCFDIRYEEVVQDLEAQAKSLFRWLELPWDPRVLAYRDHARTRRIATPSYRQVVQPVYVTAKGRWTRYREQLAPVLPILAPLAERLGYPVDELASSK